MTKLNGRSGAVGYKQPPAHTRFTKGRSGNPKGRPKGSRAGNTLAGLMNQTITVTMDGAPRKVPLTEALAMSLARKGLDGNIAAAREFMKIAEKVEAQQKEEVENRPGPIYEFTFPVVDPKHCNTSLETLGIIKEVGDCWRIETWAVEAAFERSQIVLDEGDRTLLGNSMVDCKALPAILRRSS